MMEINVEKRTQILNLLNTQFLIPEEYKETAKHGIKKYANANYSDNILQSFVDEPQSLSQNIRYLNNSDSEIKLNDLSRFRGILSEWLVCMEYNGMKNKGSIAFTFVNPDPTSKADLLHIININGYYKVVAGPDVKSGQARYLLEQWEKNLKSKYEIPMVDIDDVLTTEENLKKLKPRQRERYEKLKEEFPNKIPISTNWGNRGIHQVMIDYFFFNSLGELPSEKSRSLIKTGLTSKRIKRDLAEKSSNLEIKTWDYFSEQSQDIFSKENNNIKTNTSVRRTQIRPNDNGIKSVNGERKQIRKNILNEVKWIGKKVYDGGKWFLLSEETKELRKVLKEVLTIVAVEWCQSNQEYKQAARNVENSSSYSSTTYEEQNYYSDYKEEKTKVSQKESNQFIEKKVLQQKSSSNRMKRNISHNNVNEKEFHRHKHIRKLPDGWRASAEKVKTAKENGFELQDGETWVEES